MAADWHYVTVAGAGDNSGDSWNNAMAMADFITHIEADAVADDYYAIEEGTYTLGEDVTVAVDASAVAPIKLVGVTADTSNEPPIISDWAAPADRPIFAMGAYFFATNEYCFINNIEFTGTDTYQLLLRAHSGTYNCKLNNSSGTADRSALYVNEMQCSVIGCEVLCSAGYAVRSVTGGDSVKVLSCYVHDSKNGIVLDLFSTVALCVIDTCSATGIDCGDHYHVTVVNNSIYNCATGIAGTTAYDITVINNIIDGCTVGANWTTATAINFWGYNFFDSDGTPRTNVAVGVGDQSAASSGMNAPAGGDFSVTQADTNVHDKALDAGDLTGATV